MEQTQATENLSQWFNLAEQTPWEPGVYEVEYEGLTRAYYSWFNGDQFQSGWHTKDAAQREKYMSSPLDLVPKKWRGLASDPSAKPKPKARGNRKVTRYVVRSYDKQKVFASFVNVDNARVYADSINEQVRITRIRFRTPEAD